MKLDEEAAPASRSTPPPGETRAAVEPAGPFAGRLGPWFATAVVATLALGIVLRFVTRSELWLDEAMTVNIARHPLGDLRHLLDHDGAPPLYYVLLHAWMKVFGTSNLGARSLSGVIGVVTLPVAWVAGRRLGGASRSRQQWLAWSTVLVVASSPYAIRYSTEARMYDLEILLVLLGYLALMRAFERATLGALAGVAVVTALLLYAQYWALYLVLVVGVALLWRARRGPEAARGPARRALVALAVGTVAFAPWVPTLRYQLQHTGTPWASSEAPPTGTYHAIIGFAGGEHVEGFVLVLVVVLLGLLGLFGAAVDRAHIDLDLRTRPAVRWEWYAFAGTLLVGLTISFIGHSAFQNRYASIVFGLFALLVAYGVLVFASPLVRYGALAVVVAFGFVGGARNVLEHRTQADQVAGVINARARTGDVVVYCPDQVGPDTARLLKGGLRQYTFPTLAGPEIVNWVDYARRNREFRRPGIPGNLADPATFAAEVVRRTAPDRTLWYVVSGGYRTLGQKCEDLVGAFGELRPTSRNMVEADDSLFEHQGLYRYSP